MSGASRADDKRVWRALRLEPTELNRASTRAWLLAASTFLLAIGVRSAQTEVAAFDACPPCKRQHERRTINYNEASKRLCEAQQRIEIFRQSLDVPTSPLFLTARDQIIKEEAVVKDAERAVARYEMPKREDFGAKMIALALLTAITILLPLFFGRLFLSHADHAGVKDIRVRWRRPYVGFALAAWLISTGCGVYTSIFAAEKTWFSWDNFCITPVSWVLLRFTELGVAFVVAAPLALMYCAGDKDIKPKVQLNDYKGGVGRYVLFLQTWSICCVVVLGFGVLPWIKWLTMSEDKNFPTLVYLLSGAGVVVPVLIIVGRFIRNAVLVRYEFEELKAAEKKKPGEKTTAQAAAKPDAPKPEKQPDDGGGPAVPEDPTRDFLGDKWWSLPASLAGGLGVIWALLEWSGIVKVLAPQ